MLLRHKKTQGDEQNWCVILSPIASELDKKRVAQKMAQVFSLSGEEAADLVGNTPIILLDNLSHPVAEQIREFFRAAGAQILLTNDVLQKRKCFRTVWPEPPSLSFLHQWDPMPVSGSGSHSEALGAEEALNEFRSLMDDEPKDSVDLPSLPILSDSEREQLLEELERWRKECIGLREENKRLRADSDRQLFGGGADFDPSASLQKEKELKEVRLLLSSTEEKYQVLKEEYREARGLYEEKISSLNVTLEQARRKMAEISEQFQAAEKQKEKMAAQISSLEEQAAASSRQTEEAGRSADERLSKASQEAEHWKLQLKMLSEKVLVLEKAKEELDRAVNEQVEQSNYWRSRHDAIAAQFASIERAVQNEKEHREKAEIRQKDLEKNQLRFIEELEAKVQEIRQWEMKCLELDKQMAQMRESFENQEKILQSNFRQMELRERELEQARRQLRDSNAQLEQRETVQRRIHLASQLTEKEARLKKLVRDQEKIESEIREREESIRQLLSEQESVEKDIVEGKQAQRHLMEQAKRDQRPGTGRFKPLKGEPQDGDDDE